MAKVGAIPKAQKLQKDLKASSILFHSTQKPKRGAVKAH